MKRVRNCLKLIVLNTLILGLAAVGSASATVPYVVNSGWQDVFMSIDEPGPDGGWGGAWDHPYTFSLAGTGVLMVTDAYLAGDYYRIWNGDEWMLDTPEVDVDPGMDAGNDPDFAFGQPEWSSAAINLDAGDYELYFQNLLLADGESAPEQYWASSGFFRVDSDVPPIPEPATAALLGLGLAAAAVVGLRRRRIR